MFEVWTSSLWAAATTCSLAKMKMSCCCCTGLAVAAAALWMSLTPTCSTQHMHRLPTMVEATLATNAQSCLAVGANALLAAASLTDGSLAVAVHPRQTTTPSTLQFRGPGAWLQVLWAAATMMVMMLVTRNKRVSTAGRAPRGLAGGEWLLGGPQQCHGVFLLGVG